MAHNTRTDNAPSILLRLSSAVALTLALTCLNRASAQTPPTNVALKGTYAASASDGVDLFTGKLEQVFPLLAVQGRGAITQGLYLPLRNSEWRVEPQFTSTTSDRTYAYVKAIQGNFVDNYARAGYSTLGKLEVVTTYGNWMLGETLSTTVLTFTSSSGAVTEFRDTLTNGQPYSTGSRGCVQSVYQPQTPPPACSRGRVFRSTDGSNAVFVAESDIYDLLAYDISGSPPPSPLHRRDIIPGTLYMADGSRVQIAGDYNNITSITDRNGNYMKFEYVTEAGYTINFLKKITDSLNREVTINYGDTTQPGYYDEIIYRGFGWTERRLRINYGPVETAMLTGESLGVPLFPGVHTQCWYTATGAPCDPGPLVGPYNTHYATSLVVPTSVVLPNNSQYSFYYNRYLEVARIKYPTGAYDDYSYTGVTGAGADGFWPPDAPSGSTAFGGKIYRRVGAVKRSDEAGQLVYEKTISNIPEIISSGTTFTLVDNLTLETKDGGGTTLAKSKHYFAGFTGLGPSHPNAPMSYGKEVKTEVLDPVSSVVLRRSEVKWEQREPYPWCGVGNLNFYTCDPATDTGEGAANDPRITEIKTTIETGQVSKRTFGYDQFNSVTDIYEYDFGGTNGGTGQLLRRTHTDYLPDSNYTAYTATYLPKLPLQSWTSSDPAGTKKTSFIKYEYDDYTTNDGHHAPLVPRSGVTGFDASYNAAYQRRGNVTAVTRYVNAQNQTGPITAYSQYDVLGNVVKTIDPRNAAVTYDYADKFGAPDGNARGNWDGGAAPQQLSGLSTFAFGTTTTNFLGATYAQYDYGTGQAVDAEDINGNVNTTFYADPLERATQVITANNRPALRSQVTTAFDDAGRKVTVTSDLLAFGDNLSKRESIYNSLGQTTETRKFEAGGYIATLSEYDALGRAFKLSNPFRPYLDESPAWLTTEFEGLGRVFKTKTPNGGEVQTDYDGNVTTVTDQAGRRRRSISNALGQLVRVDEPNDQNDLGPVTNPTRATSYLYNANGQMVKVTQGQQSRFFQYDSAGRLLRVRQPEQERNANLDFEDLVSGNTHWTTYTTYDGNGNALTTTDAKGVVVTRTYDDLNRVETTTYSDGTPPVTFTYDDPAVPFSKGKLTKVASSVSTTEYTEFDQLGRVRAHRQTTSGQPYTTAYTYTFAGVLRDETYPSGRVVRNSYDGDGRLSEVSGRAAGQPSFHPYADSFAYTASEAVREVRFGNNLWETTQLNALQQVKQISLGSVQEGHDLWKATYEYGEFDAAGNLLADKNSGNVARHTTTFDGLGDSYVQTYRYDPLNRLSEAVEMKGATQTWQQTFGYDRYGNRTSINQQKLGTAAITQTPSVNPLTNRFEDGQGFVYDPNGNVTQDPEGRRFTFNGDNKQTEVRDSANDVIGYYFYDGAGRRVKKVTAFEQTVYVYDAAGKLLAEYSTQAGSGSTSYLTADKLGSPRVITNGAGAVVARRDFMPFGEELPGETAGRTTAAKYGNGRDNVRQRFTGYEKDYETGLDFAQARYYDNRLGRFTAVDPLLASGQDANPQTFNRYVYVSNTPVTATDPTGLFSDRDWYTSEDYTIIPADLPSIKQPIPYQEFVTTYQRRQQGQPPPSQPAPAQPPAPQAPTAPEAGPPPVDEFLDGSPMYTEAHPRPAGVRIFVPEPEFHFNFRGIGNGYTNGVWSTVIVTVVDAQGRAIDERFYVQETVTGTVRGEEATQNRKPHFTENNWRDYVGVHTDPSSTPDPDYFRGRRQAGAALTPYGPTTVTQTWTIVSPSTGTSITVTDTQTVTNLGSPKVDNQGVYYPNYSVRVNVTNVKVWIP